MPVALSVIAGVLGHTGTEPGSGAARAVVEVIFAMHGAQGQDPVEALDTLCEALSGAGLERSRVDAFRNVVLDVLDARRARRAREIDDGGDLLLRALTLVIFRDRTWEVLSERVEGQAPGPRILVTAAALAGMREGSPGSQRP